VGSVALACRARVRTSVRASERECVVCLSARVRGSIDFMKVGCQ